MEEKKRVLIVEDEKSIVDIVRFNLEKEGYAVLTAYDGDAGLSAAREERPDLILLDVMLPRMNGFEVCRALRQAGDNVPVIILTAREEETDKVLGLEIGADDYITKPFSMRELIARVGANIRRTSMAAPAGAAAAVRNRPSLWISFFNCFWLAPRAFSRPYSRIFCTTDTWKILYITRAATRTIIERMQIQGRITSLPGSSAHVKYPSLMDICCSVMPISAARVLIFSFIPSWPSFSSFTTWKHNRVFRSLLSGICFSINSIET